MRCNVNTGKNPHAHQPASPMGLRYPGEELLVSSTNTKAKSHCNQALPFSINWLWCGGIDRPNPITSFATPTCPLRPTATCGAPLSGASPGRAVNAARTVTTTGFVPTSRHHGRWQTARLHVGAHQAQRAGMRPLKCFTRKCGPRRLPGAPACSCKPAFFSRAEAAWCSALLQLTLLAHGLDAVVHGWWPWCQMRSECRAAVLVRGLLLVLGGAVVLWRFQAVERAEAGRFRATCLAATSLRP